MAEQVSKPKKHELTVEPIWDRQPFETSKQYLWFTRYKDCRLNGGSLRSMMRQYDKHERYINVLGKWSSANRWVQRVEAYFMFLEKEKERAQLERIQDMNNRHSKTGTILQNIFAAWLSSNRDKFETMKPETALRFFEAGARVERLAISSILGGDQVNMLSEAKRLTSIQTDLDIVDVQEFVESKHYMDQKDAVRPKIMEKLWELFHGDDAEAHIEVVLGGGIGWGKSYMTEMGMAYMLYKLSCYPSPQEEFGLAPGSSIFFVMQSVKLELAKKVLFEPFRQRISRSEYFCKKFPFDKDITSELRFPRNIRVMPLSSSDTSALSLNVFGGCFPADQEYLRADGTLGRLGDCETSDVMTVEQKDQCHRVCTERSVRAIPTGWKRLVRVHLSNGTKIVCTPDQKIKVRTDEWVRAEVLNGQHLSYAHMPQRENKYAVKEAEFTDVLCVDVEDLGITMPVYDLQSVPVTHTFLAKAGNGFVLAHNCIDELNFFARVERPSSSRFTGEGEYDQAESLYTTIVRRMKSRFNDKGRVPGKLFLISSANYPGDFIDRKIQEAEAEKEATGKSNIFVVRFAQWDTYSPDKISPERFLVEVGDETRNSRIIATREEAVDESRIIEVPMDYWREFNADIEASIRDLAGLPVGGVSAFIKRRETIERAATIHEELHGKSQLFVSDSVDLSAFSNRLESLLNTEYLQDLDLTQGGYCVSVDLALTGDSCGLAVGHAIGQKAVGKSIVWDEERKRYTERPACEEPIIAIDGVLEIVPPKADQIDINEIGNLIELLNTHLTIDAVTADSFQSAALLQRMRKLSNRKGRPVRANVLSVDTTLAPYMAVKQALRDERMSFPNVARLKKELRELILDDSRQKIDHPPTGSKDLSDAVAASSYISALRYARHVRGAGRAILAGIDAPMEEAPTQKVRPRSGHRRLQ